MKNWAYKFDLNHEGAGVESIYYVAAYFDKEGIVNPKSAEAYTDEEIKTIKDNAKLGNENYIFDVPDNVFLGMKTFDGTKQFWYDAENAKKILACANPLCLDSITGEMKDAQGNVVAVAID